MTTVASLQKMGFWTDVLRHNWTPNGDTTFLGGITIVFYGVTALLCIMAAFRGRNPTDLTNPTIPTDDTGTSEPSLHQESLHQESFHQESLHQESSNRFSPLNLVRHFEKFWLWVGLIFIFFALHKYFNWLVGLTNFIRNRAYYYAWYSSRRTVQNQFTIVAIVLALLAVAWILWRMRQGAISKQFAIIGLVSLLIFVVIRSISLHSVDALLYHRYMGGIQLNRVIELGGTGIVAISAICSWRRWHHPLDYLHSAIHS